MSPTNDCDHKTSPIQQQSVSNKSSSSYKIGQNRYIFWIHSLKINDISNKLSDPNKNIIEKY